MAKGIVDGQLVQASTDNAAFIAKNADDETTNKLGLKRVGSGTLLDDAQQAINDNTSNIATNAANIATNTTNISNNASNLATHEVTVSGIHGVGAGDIVGTTKTQTLTNKIYEGGTAANTSRVTIPAATKATLDGLTRVAGTVVYATDEEILYLDDGTDLKPVGAGLGVKATYYDPISTTLPTGASVTIDGQAGVNGDTVLFGNLSSGNNRVYELGGVGSSITWTVTKAYAGQTDPTDGDFVRILKGDAFRDQMAVFDGADFKVNDIVRYFDGVSGNFWEQSSLKTSTLSDGTTDNVFSVTSSGSENFNIRYSITRGTQKETGVIVVTHDGTNAELTRTSANLGDTGVSFSADILSGNIRLRYTTTATGSDATMKYFVERWSDSAGGPTGIPNYTGAGTGTTAAAGGAGQIQFNTGGFLDADSEFQYDTANDALKLGSIERVKLLGPISLNDNQVTPIAIFNYPASYKYMMIDYSVSRGGEERVGHMYIPNNGTAASISEEFVETATLGVSFSVSVSGGNVNVLYTTTSTGSGASFKYAMKRWS